MNINKVLHKLFYVYETLDGKVINKLNEKSFTKKISECMKSYINDNDMSKERAYKLIDELYEKKALCVSYELYLHRFDLENIDDVDLESMSKLEALAYLTYIHRMDYWSGGYSNIIAGHAAEGVFMKICLKFS